MKKINTYKTFVNKGVDKMTPKSQEELLNDSPNFTELYSDVKHWTKRYKDIVVSDIEFNIYGHVCYAFFKIIVDGTSPVQEYDQTYDKNVLMVICYSDDQISLLLKKKHVYEWETISHYTEFTEIIKEMNKLRTVNEGIRDKMTPRHMDDIKQSFKDRGYDFGKQLLSATFINDVDSVEPILDLMYDVYTTTDSDDIRETITENYITGLDEAVEDGSCDMVELYLSYNIPGLGMSHLQKSLYNYNTRVMELIYDRLKDGMSEEERQDTEAKIEDKRMNESVRDKMTPKSKSEVRELIKNKIGTDKDVITVRFYNPVGDEQWTRMRKQLKNKLIKIEVINNSYSKVTGDVIDVYEFMVYYMGFGMSYTINFINREMVNESLRDKMTPKSRDDIKFTLKDIPRDKMFLAFCKSSLNSDDLDMWLDLGVDINMTDDYDNTVLHELCWMDGVDNEVKRLLGLGADPNIMNKRGETPLIISVINTNIPVLRVILDSGKLKPYEHNQINTAIDLTRKDEDIRKILIDYELNQPLAESLQDGLTMKPIEHITSVGDFYRYNFIEDGNEVGYIMIDNGCDLFLSSFTIWDPYKGKGLGRKYLNIILDELRKFTEYPWVGLSVKKDNEIAIKLYQSVGFRKVNEVQEYEGPGKNYKNVLYYYMVKENR